MTTADSREGIRPYGFFAVVILAALMAMVSALAHGTGRTGVSGPTGDDPVQSAALVESGCTACHASLGGALLAPSLEGVYARAGRRVSEEDYVGAASDADGYLLESILDHCADPLPGWDCEDAPQYGNWISLDDAYLLVDAMARSR